MMASHCWLCGDLSASRKDLKLHLMGRPHHIFKVICPFCHPQERTCNKISDLKKHIDKYHPGLTTTDTLKGWFTEAAGFYLSVNPYDYRRIIDPISPDAQIAKAIKESIRTWIPSITCPSRVLSDWEQGWAQSIGTPLRDELPNQYLPYSPTRPGMSKYPVEPYSPTRPEIFTATKLKVKVLSRCVLKPISCVFETQTGMQYVAVLANNASTLTQLNNLKITSVNCSDEVDSYQYTVLSDALANTLQISQTLIDTVYKVTKDSCSINDSNNSQSPIHACLPPSDIPALPVSTSYTQETPENNLRAIASELLLHGLFPLGMPAKRDWESAPSREIVKGSYHVQWPPKNWTAMDGRRRFQLFLHAAMNLDVDQDGNPISTIDQIVTKYTFLMLPSTPVPREYHPIRLQVETFLKLKEIVKTGKDTYKILDMYQLAAASRSKELDTILKQIADVKIRI